MNIYSLLDGMADFWRGAPPPMPQVPRDCIGGKAPGAAPVAERLGRAICTGGNRLKLLNCGHEALPAMLEAIESATHHIHLQTMLFFDDRAGQILEEALCKKVRQGVQVRVLFEYLTTALGDPFFSKGLSPFSVMELAERMASHGIMVRDSASFPLSLLDDMEAEILLGELQRLAELERKYVPEAMYAETVAMQKKVLRKAEALFRSNTLNGLLALYRALLKKFSPKVHQLLTPLRYLRQFMLHNHRKILVIDGRSAFCGGMNVGQEYLYHEPFDPRMPAKEESEKAGNPEPWVKWHDVGVQIEGPAVNRLQRLFFNHWRAHLLEGESDAGLSEEAAYFPGPERPGKSVVWTLVQAPGRRNQIQERLLQEIAWSRKRVQLMNPYLIHDGFVGALVGKAREGVEVQVLMSDWNNDSFLHQAVMQGCCTWYNRAGVSVQEYSNHFTHAKILVVDDRLTHVGSFNFNNRSSILDFECSLLVEDRDFARETSRRLFTEPTAAKCTREIHQSVEHIYDIDLTLGAKAVLDLCPEIF